MPASSHETDIALKAYQEKVAAEKAAQEQAAKEAQAAAANAADEGEDNGQAEEAERIRLEQEAEAARLAAENAQNEIDYDKIDYEKINFDKVLETKTAGRFKSYQEIEEQLNKEKEEPRYTDSFIEKYTEAAKRGVKPEVFLKTQTIDFSKLSEIEKVKHGMRLESPELSDEEVSVIVEDMYRIDEDEYDEKTVKLAKINLKKDALRYEKNLLEWQVKAIETPVDIESQKAAKAREEAELKNKEFKARWEKDTTAELAKFKELRIKTGSDEKDFFSYVPEKTEMEFVKEVVKSPEKIWSLFRNEDGTTDIPKLIEGIALLKSARSLAPKMADAMKANAIEEYIKGKKNVDFSSGNKNQQNQPKNDDTIRQLARDLM